MQHLEFKPPPALQDAIKCFWYDSREFGAAETSFDVMPDGYAEIIFYFGSCSISHNGILQPLPSPFIMGLLNQPARFYTKGNLEIVAVRCFPWTVFDLLGLASGKGLRLFEHPVAQLQPVLKKYVKTGKIEDAISVLQQFFTDVRSNLPSGSMLSKAGVAMTKAKGNMPVSEVAAAAHATVRTLERNFKQSSGYTVKDVSALMRFEQARNHLWLAPASALAALAHELGYTDQSHLSREFKRFSGTTPAAFARKAKTEQLNIMPDLTRM